jgi:Phytanoyl-CoA dioxygenase (PhyH)
MRRGRSLTPRERPTDGPEPSRGTSSLELYLEKWISRLAVFGDSATAVVVTFLVMCLAVYVTTYCGAANQRRHERISTLHDESRHNYPVYTVNRTQYGYVAALSEEVREAFLRDGVVAIRGLVRPTLVDAVHKESATLLNPKPRKGAQFHTASHNSLFVSDALWQVAAESEIPAVVVQLLLHELSSATSDNQEPPTPNVTSLRIMRDIFLAKSSDDSYICGWHVDDLGFWPATPESPGINAWIALERDQTSFALAVGSHRASWRHRAYHVTGAPHGFPPGGYANAGDYVTRRPGSGTCNLKKAAPDLHRLMEESSRVYTLQPGDVIFHTRWLFHRTVVSARTDSALEGKDPHRRMERRYSVRYGPGSSVIPPGYGTELSVLWDPSNGGRTADEVCASDGPWYPAVWPGVLESERAALPGLVRDKLPVAAQRRKARESEMAPLVRQIARERSGSLLPR